MILLAKEDLIFYSNCKRNTTAKENMSTDFAKLPFKYFVSKGVPPMYKFLEGRKSDTTDQH